MKYIIKSKEPTSLIQYRQQIDAHFDGYSEKNDLRNTLLKEQKYICCYCMQRITTAKMKIEHFIPQSDKEEGEKLQLVYRNLLGACLGNEGQPKHLQHCDTHKANQKITINPTLQNCEYLIKFDANGKVSSDNFEINKDLNETLNLNTESLIENRRQALDSALQELANKNSIAWTKEILQREIDKWNAVNDEKYKPYCQIVIFYLKKKLTQVV
jgi:uncharacterized protein (TIGR02646 family)